MDRISVRGHTRRRPHKPDPEDGTGMEFPANREPETDKITTRDPHKPGPQRDERTTLRRGTTIIGGGDKRSPDKPQQGVTIRSRHEH